MSKVLLMSRFDEGTAGLCNPERGYANCDPSGAYANCDPSGDYANCDPSGAYARPRDYADP